jgi:hypothetical protein
MSAPTPPAGATEITIKGTRNGAHLVRALLRRLGVRVGPDLGKSEESLGHLPSSGDSTYEERFATTRWTFGAVTVEKIKWATYDPNDHTDSGGVSEESWNLRGLPEGGAIFFVRGYDDLTLHVSGPSPASLVEVVNEAADETAPTTAP